MAVTLPKSWTCVNSQCLSAAKRDTTNGRRRWKSLFNGIFKAVILSLGLNGIVRSSVELLCDILYDAGAAAKVNPTDKTSNQLLEFFESAYAIRELWKE